MRRVVITGMGAITPLGDSVEALFAGQLEGRSGVGPITRFDASTFPTRIAAEVRGFELSRYLPDASRWRGAGVASQFAAAAGRLALRDAGLSDARFDPSRGGAYLGTGEGAQDFQAVLGIVAASYRPATRDIDPAALTREGMTRYDPAREYQQELHTPVAHLADCFGLEGPNYSCLTACAAGAQAVGEALDLVRRGEADFMLTGGTHSMIYPLGVTGFSLLTALSTRNDVPHKASRPFDRLRDGFVIGEGAGLVVLEELEHARRRGATIHAELTGYGVTADSYRATDSHPEGRGAVACMRMALRDARLSPDEIGYVNAHGTSTKINDRAETVALKAVFGEAAARLPVSSSKGALGHLIGAAGAVELITCVRAIQTGWLPPTVNYETPDPDCDLDYLPQPRRASVRHALSNSFGFGGQNASLIVSRFEG